MNPNHDWPNGLTRTCKWTKDIPTGCILHSCVEYLERHTMA